MHIPGRRFLLGSIPAIAFGVAARAQSLADIDQREAAVTEAWDKTPLTVRRSIFIAQRPTGYGMYEPRPNSIFKPGEPLLIYAEPIGFGWKPVENDMFEFGFAIDVALKTGAGKELGGQENFARLVQRSHVRNREFMLTLTMNLTGVPPDEMIIAYKLRDVTGPKVATFELPFTVKA